MTEVPSRESTLVQPEIRLASTTAGSSFLSMATSLLTLDCSRSKISGYAGLSSCGRPILIVTYVLEK